MSGAGDVVTIRARGPWSRIVMEDVASGRRIVPAVEVEIERAWLEGLGRGVKLFDGPTCRLESFEPDADGRGVTIRYSRSSYKVFYGTNLYRPHLRQAYGAGVMGDPVGMSTALRTADGFLVFGRRNESVAYYPGRVHPFSGALEPGEHPFDAVRRELDEELHLAADEVRSLELLGIVEDRGIFQPELVFQATTTRTLADLTRTLDPDEHHGIVSYPADRPPELGTIGDHLTPVAVGTLQLYATCNRPDSP